ncbi:MAG TPA: ATP-binding protein [Clostridia bacterium]|nr:ATP-binding protein [Clostridia bacterium]
MKIAVLSGKGGTGKTFISVNLAAIAENSQYIDCDVEEPNGHLFFKPDDLETRNITVKIPVVDRELCNGCRACVEFCKFNALAHINNQVMVFEDICHSCGGCSIVCPQNAISEKDKGIGRVEHGNSQGVFVWTGILNPGEPSGVPIIEDLLENKDDRAETTIIDCPPGSACVVMESIKDADYCVLVGEPTVFGAHNLNMVYELVKLFKKPHGVVLNKIIGEEDPAEDFCVEKGIDILEKIPFSDELGTLNSNALIAVREKDEYKELFSNLLKGIIEEVRHETVVDSQR